MDTFAIVVGQAYRIAIAIATVTVTATAIAIAIAIATVTVTVTSCIRAGDTTRTVPICSAGAGCHTAIMGEFGVISDASTREADPAFFADTVDTSTNTATCCH
jgi:hypothetical protein